MSLPTSPKNITSNTCHHPTILNPIDSLRMVGVYEGLLIKARESGTNCPCDGYCVPQTCQNRVD